MGSAVGKLIAFSDETNGDTPPVYVIRLTEMREIKPYVWVHPDEVR
jgi:hypothetical protein